MNCNGTHKNILFIGEGNFSYSRSLVEKHNISYHPDGINRLSITASDLFVSRSVFDHFNQNPYVLLENGINNHVYNCDGCVQLNIAQLNISNGQELVYCDNCFLTINNINWLIENRSTVIFGLDASTFPQSNHLEENYSKIYWVMPHDRSSYTSASLPNLISQFCISASQLQEENDKIHLVISQNRQHHTKTYHTEFQQGKVYNIIESPFIAGYVLSKRIKVNNERYPYYSHQKTHSTESVKNGMFPEEFIFSKRNIEGLGNNLYFITARNLRNINPHRYYYENLEVCKEYFNLLNAAYTINKKIMVGLLETPDYMRFSVNDKYLAPVDVSDNYDESDDDESDEGNESVESDESDESVESDEKVEGEGSTDESDDDISNGVIFTEEEGFYNGED